MPTKTQIALAKAIDWAGCQADLARELDVTPQAVNNWWVRKKIPWYRAVQIEEVTGGLVTREELCPEKYTEGA
jgi:DNA-binding transcriptional regulator YdaS (Cro superfamily)